MSKDETKKESSEGEDIPSDFFDDFNKDDFMDGLSVIDSWNNEEKRRSRGRIDEEAVNSVNDLRELIAKEEKHDRNISKESHQGTNYLDDYIRPGSRRDPSKTQEAIRRDKEVKVKEFLAKHLESGDDLRPPGTELDDYYEETIIKKKKLEENQESKKRSVKERHDEKDDKQRFSYRNQEDFPVKRRRESPRRRRESPLRVRYVSPMKHRRESPPRNRRSSPPRNRRSRSIGREPMQRRNSPVRYRSPRFSPRRPTHVPRWSPRRSPHRRGHRPSPDLRRERRSRSPYKRNNARRSHSSSKNRLERDDFLYPERYNDPLSDSNMPMQTQYMAPVSSEYGAPSYQYAQGPAYTGYSEPYYPAQTEPQPIHMPQPVPPPVAMAPLNSTMVPAPCMVPAPQQPSPSISINPLASQIMETTPASPYDALAKLVADGKLSHEDYLKLAPNKGVITPNMDPKARVSVLNRCHQALSQLGSLTLPNRLLINNLYIGQEQKSIAPRFCSPLKRQSSVEFHFSKTEKSTVMKRNKQIIDSIICALSLDKVVSRPKKKVQKDVKEVSVQTLKPVCEVCEIRETTKFCDASTSTDPEYFTSTVHTQVIEEDLYSSKAVFNPSGSSSSTAPISIAHLTPAQLVSQLAARAKTLKQPDQPQSSPRGNRPNFDFDYNRRGGNQYQNPNYNNYRY